MTSASGEVAYAGGMGGFGESLARSSIATLVFSVARRKDLKQFKATLDYLKQRVDQVAAANVAGIRPLLRGPGTLSGRRGGLGEMEQAADPPTETGPGARRQLPRPDWAARSARRCRFWRWRSIFASCRSTNDRSKDTDANQTSAVSMRPAGEHDLLRLWRVLGARRSWSWQPWRLRERPSQPAAGPSFAVLHLTDGSFVAGELCVTRPGRAFFRWQASAFVSPFEFPVNRVNAIHWPPPAALAQARRRLLLRAGRRRRRSSVRWSRSTTSKPSSTFPGSAGCTSIARSFIESIAGATAPTSSISGRMAWPAGARRRRPRTPSGVDAEHGRGRIGATLRRASGGSPRKAGAKNRVSS